jgi:hypothetical protein
MLGLINTLIKDWLLTEKRGCEAYIHAFRQIVLPVGWSRFQNPVTHYKSYGFAEKFRLSLLLPFIFARFFNESHCRESALSKIKSEFYTELEVEGRTIRSIFLHLLVLSAQNSYYVAAEAMTESEQIRITDHMLGFRKYFQRFAKLCGTSKDEDAGSKLTKRPNIHQALHVHQYLLDYATLKNCEVSVGERKHKEAKAKAVTANKVSVDKQIMVEAARKDSIRDAAQGIRIDTHPAITNSLQLIQKQCPTITAKIQHWDLEDYEIEEEAQSIVGTGQAFANIRVSQQLTMRSIKHFPTKLTYMSLLDIELRTAYSRDFDIHDRDLGRFQEKIRYRSYVSVIAKSTAAHATASSTVSLKSGQWIKLCKALAPRSGQTPLSHVVINAIFTHERLHEHRVFFIVKFASPAGYDNDVQCDIYRYPYDVSPSFRVIGLPMVDPVGGLHFLPVAGRTLMEPPKQNPEDGIFTWKDGQQLFWHNARVAQYL